MHCHSNPHLQPNHQSPHVSRHVLHNLLAWPIALRVACWRVARHRLCLAHRLHLVLEGHDRGLSVSLQNDIAISQLLDVPHDLPRGPVVAYAHAQHVVTKGCTCHLVFANDHLMLRLGLLVHVLVVQRHDWKPTFAFSPGSRDSARLHAAWL